MSEEFCGELSKLVKHIHCSICLNLMTEPKMTQCLHRFCGKCIATLIQSNEKSGDSKQICQCPQCNEEITEKSLRDQLELKDVINKLRNTINILKTDTNLSQIWNKVVLLSLNDSTIGENNGNNNKENEESIVDKTKSNLESNRQKSMITTTIDEVMSSWPTNNSISNENVGNNNSNDDTIEELCETQNDSNINEILNDSSIFQYSNNSIEFINDNEVSNVAKNMSKQSDVQSNTLLHLKSQDLIVNRSSVSYGLQRKLNKSDDIFNKIVSKSNQSFNSNNKLKSLNNNNKRKQTNNRANKRYNHLFEDESDIDFDAAKYAADLVAPMSKFKPLIQQNQTSISGNISENKKKFKRIRNIESDDEMVENVKVMDNVEHKQQIKSVLVAEKNGNDSENEFSGLSDDELMVSIHSNGNQTKESIITSDVSLQNDTNSSDSFNSETQLISSSPISGDGSV